MRNPGMAPSRRVRESRKHRPHEAPHDFTAHGRAKTRASKPDPHEGLRSGTVGNEATSGLEPPTCTFMELSGCESAPWPREEPCHSPATACSGRSHFVDNCDVRHRTRVEIGVEPTTRSACACGTRLPAHISTAPRLTRGRRASIHFLPARSTTFSMKCTPRAPSYTVGKPGACSLPPERMASATAAYTFAKAVGVPERLGQAPERHVAHLALVQTAARSSGSAARVTHPRPAPRYSYKRTSTQSTFRSC